MPLECHISIHPPLAGWDLDDPAGRYSHYISIHPPLAGWDMDAAVPGHGYAYFNPPTPCGVGQYTPRAWEPGRTFQSTHPLRGGTIAPADLAADTNISIHPPLAGWDGSLRGLMYHADNFNPPTPCGVGPSPTTLSSLIQNFNPPTPCGVGPWCRACH